jgi:hypothetical protein
MARKINVTRHPVIDGADTDERVVMSTADIGGAHRHHLIERDNRLVLVSHDEAGNEVHAIDAADALSFLAEAPAGVRDKAAKMVIAGYDPAERSVAKLLAVKKAIEAFDKPTRDGRILDRCLAAAPVDDWQHQTQDWLQDAAVLFKQIEPFLAGENTDYRTPAQGRSVGAPPNGDAFGNDHAQREKFEDFCGVFMRFRKLKTIAAQRIDHRLMELGHIRAEDVTPPA